MKRPRTRRRLLFVALGLAAVAVYVMLAVGLYRSRVDPEGAPGWTGPLDWILGPSWRELNAAASRHLDLGVEALDAGSAEPSKRLESYREHMRQAESLLVRSLRAQPAQAWALAKLAALRWELDTPVTPEARKDHLEMIRLASGMAPNDPVVQRELGRLLLMTGLRDDGAGYLRRAVEIDSRISDEVVELMTEFFFGPEDMLSVLPRSADALASLRRPFLRSGSGERYVAVLESELAPDIAEPSILRAFGEACLELELPDRLVASLEALGVLESRPAEAERALQLALGLSALGSSDEAVAAARRAAELEAGSDRFREQLGVVTMRGGDLEGALAAFRDALALAARGGAPERRRGVLYRRVGQALDRLGRSDQAYDAYRMALELHPDDQHAGRRVREMEQAAGLWSDS